MRIAVIPARGGSKRIPRKNIKSFCGKPIIAWSIEAARSAALFDAIVVSTDDEEIVAVAEAYGAEAPFRRPKELADDFAPTLPVIGHAVSWFEQHRGPIEYACCIYATAPFLRSQYLSEGLRTLQADREAEFAFSITSFRYPIFRALRCDSDGTIAPFWPEYELKRSQDLPQAWHDAGQFYWGTPMAFQTRRGVFSARSLGVVLPHGLVQDIDTEEDWHAAEAIFSALNRSDPPASS